MKLKKELPTGIELMVMRKERGQAQDDAARSIDYKVKSWYQWENGIREMPRAAWVLYQLGGIDAILNGEAFTPANPAPARPVKKEEEFVHPLLASRPENYKRVIATEELLPEDRRVDNSPYHTLTCVGVDDDLREYVWYDNRDRKLVFDNLRIGLRNDSPIKHIVRAGSRRITAYLFAPHVAVNALSIPEQQERDAIETEAIKVKGRHTKSMGKDKGASEHYMSVKDDVDFILKFAPLQPRNVEDIKRPLAEGILQEHIDHYDMDGNSWLTDDAPELKEERIDPSERERMHAKSQALIEDLEAKGLLDF